MHVSAKHARHRESGVKERPPIPSTSSTLSHEDAPEGHPAWAERGHFEDVDLPSLFMLAPGGDLKLVRTARPPRNQLGLALLIAWCGRNARRSRIPPPSRLRSLLSSPPSSVPRKRRWQAMATGAGATRASLTCVRSAVTWACGRSTPAMRAGLRPSRQ